MTPLLLLAMLAILIAVLVWQLLSLWRWHSGRRAVSQEPLPRPRPKPALGSQVALLDDASSRAVKRERKRGLKAINAAFDGPTTAKSLIKSSLYNEVEGKLTQAFELYQEGSVSIDGYETIVRIEGKVVHRKRSELTAREMSDSFSTASLDELRQDVEAAEIAIQWCLDWAAERRASALATPSDPDQG